MYILYACSDAYTPYLGVSILSLFENNKDLKTIEVFICDDKISDENKKKLLCLGERFGRKVTFVDNSILNITARKLRWRIQGGSFSTYSKIVADQLLPEYVDRVLYIDSSDTLIVGSLRDLETLEMGDKVFAARVAVSFHVTGNTTPSYDFCIAKNKTYYNCGVFLMNMEKWREFKCFDLISDKSLSAPHFDTFDQTVINAYLPEEYGMKLPLKYNFNGYTYSKYMETKKLSIGGFYSEEEIREASENPVIIHWPGSTHHPYVRGGLCRNKEQYRAYIEKSPWKDDITYPCLFKLLKKPQNKRFSTLYKYYPLIEFYCPRLSEGLYKLFCKVVKK